ncbi:hypothetical protein Btru_025268 [Bulinus truncatus]|nr:hypothetical protein Btru_025268 [Bulinus truncatus]
MYECMDNYTTSLYWTFNWTTSLNWTAPSSPYLESSSAIKSRNLWIGAAGIFLNVAGLALLVTTKNIKASLKISLLSLTLNDVMFLSALVARSRANGVAMTTGHAFCWPTMFASYTSVLISYLSTCQLALQNCVAVFYPLRCHEVVTPVKAFASSAGVWVLGLILCIGCIGIKFAEEVPCIALVPIPSWGIATYASICILCSAVVSVVNLKIFCKIRKMNRSIHVAPQSSPKLISGASLKITGGRRDKVKPLNDSDASSSRGTSSWKTKSELSMSLGEVRGRPCDVWMTGESQSSEGMPSSKNRSTYSHRSRVVAQQGETNNVSDTHQVETGGDNRLTRTFVHSSKASDIIAPEDCRITQIMNSQQSFNTTSLASSPKSLRRKVLVASLTNAKQRKNSEQTNMGDAASSASSSPKCTNTMASGARVERNDRSIRRHGQVKVRNTLLLLTFWCCLVTTPFVVSVFILVSSKNFVQVEFAQSEIGIALSSLVALNASTNPILYVWRFVRWKTLYSNTSRYFSRGCPCSR